jgi:hypothetical protein
MRKAPHERHDFSTELPSYDRERNTYHGSDTGNCNE